MATQQQSEPQPFRARTPACHLIQVRGRSQCWNRPSGKTVQIWHPNNATDKTNVRRTAWEPD
jgi:hypothetical protein